MLVFSFLRYASTQFLRLLFICAGAQHLPAALHTGHAAAEVEEEEEAGPGTPTELDRAVEVAAA